MQSIQTQSQETVARLLRRNLQRYESALTCLSPRFRNDRITPAKTQTRNHKLPEQIVLQSSETQHNRWPTLCSRRNACETVFHLLCTTHYSTYIANRCFCPFSNGFWPIQDFVLLFYTLVKLTLLQSISKSNAFEIDGTVTLLFRNSYSRRA